MEKINKLYLNAAIQNIIEGISIFENAQVIVEAARFLKRSFGKTEIREKSVTRMHEGEEPQVLSFERTVVTDNEIIIGSFSLVKRSEGIIYFQHRFQGKDKENVTYDIIYDPKTLSVQKVVRKRYIYKKYFSFSFFNTTFELGKSTPQDTELT